MLNLLRHISFGLICYFLGMPGIMGQYSFIGNGEMLNDQCVELTSKSNYQKGWAFSTEKIRIDQKVVMEFDFYVGDNDWRGADGMVFMLHNDPRGLTAEGCVGEAMGYGDHPAGPFSNECGFGTRKAITPSIAFEFDTYQNGAQGDPFEDHIAYLENGNINHGNDFVFMGNLEDGEVHTMKFVWNPKNNRIKLSIDGVVVIKFNRNIRDLIFNNATEVYWGFSASTGGAMNQHYFCLGENEATLTFADNMTIASGGFDSDATWLMGAPATGADIVINEGHKISLTGDKEIGSLHLNTNGGLDIGSHELTVNGSIFEIEGTLDANHGTLNFSGNQDQELHFPENQAINNIISNNPGVVSLDEAGSIEIFGSLDINQGTFETNDQLTLKSIDLNESGRISELANGATLEGEITMERYIWADRRLYRYLSSPVKSTSVEDIQNYIPVTGDFVNPSELEGVNSSTASFYYYDETKAGLLDIGYVAYPEGIHSSEAILETGRGYAVFVRNNDDRPEVLSVQGEANQGDISIPLTYTAAEGASEDGWNLIGNPYPSPIDWAKVDNSQRSNVADAIYFTDNDNPSQIKRSFVGGIGNPKGTTGVIAPFQGFWVRTEGTNPGLTLRESNKTSSDFLFFREEAPEATNFFRVRLELSNGQYDETVIRFHTDATDGFDSGLDAYKLNQKVVKIFSRTANGDNLSINSVNENWETMDTIQLVMENMTWGTHTLTIENLTSVNPHTNIFLLDSYNGSVTNLRESPVFNFEINDDPATRGAMRFSIVSGTSYIVDNENIITSVEPNFSETTILSVFPNPSPDGILHISGKILGEEGSLSVLDNTGRVRYEIGLNELSDIQESSLNLSFLETGAYHCVVNTTTQHFAQSLVIQ